ncbi:MAG TPA: hypothetical protein PKG82_04115, partial [Myxococcota bacterium]|nr:hypothetical protein [Myxococcota bacterium]
GQIRAVVMAEVTATPGGRVRRRRLLTVVAAVVAVLLAGAGTATAFRDLVDLVDKGMLIQNPGGGRSTSYRLNI